MNVPCLILSWNDTIVWRFLSSAKSEGEITASVKTMIIARL